MGREIRHQIKAPSWPKEALAGRVLSEGGRGPPVPGGGQEWLEMGLGSHPQRGLFGFPGKKLCDLGGRGEMARAAGGS